MNHMSVSLNHTIVRCSDKEASARFLVEILGLPEPTSYGPFVVVQTDNDVSLDYADAHGRPQPQHYAFMVSDAEFDEVQARIVERTFFSTDAVSTMEAPHPVTRMLDATPRPTAATLVMLMHAG